MKRCPDCKIEKPSEGFCKNRARPDGLASICKKCTNLRTKKWVSEQDPEELARKKRNRRLQREYGMTLQEWEFMFAWQGERCAICETDGHVWHTDHDHTTRVVRGILCHTCNTVLGNYEAGWRPGQTIEAFERYLNW